MEVNTVILSLFEYNTLRDFKENLEKNNTYHVLGYYDTWCGQTNTTTFVSTDEAVKMIAEKNETLSKKIADLTQEIYDLKHPKEKEPTTTELKKYSFWKLYKWWRKKR